MKFYSKFLVAGLLVGSGSVASAASVNLSTWIGTAGGNWVVQAPDNDSVLQTINGQPTFFYEPNTSSQGLALSGNITVTTTNDDDFIGFALGLDASDLNSASSDFILVDWKQGDQSGALEGLAISHVTNSASGDFWNHSGGVTEFARATNLGSTGWADQTEYSFDLQFTPGLIQVSVDGSLELSVTAADAGLASFGDGAFAFYNYSQGNVLYGAIEEDVAAPTPPNAIPEVSSYGTLLALGLLSLTVRSRRR